MWARGNPQSVKPRELFSFFGVSINVLQIDHVIYLNHRKNIDTLLLVALGNSLGTKETSFFSRVPVEFDRAVGAEASVDEGTENLKDGYSARAIVISTGGATPQGQPHVDGILVGADNDGGVSQGLVLALEAS